MSQSGSVVGPPAYDEPEYLPSAPGDRMQYVCAGVAEPTPASAENSSGRPHPSLTGRSLAYVGTSIVFICAAVIGAPGIVKPAALYARISTARASQRTAISRMSAIVFFCLERVRAPR